MIFNIPNMGIKELLPIYKKSVYLFISVVYYL